MLRALSIPASAKSATAHRRHIVRWLKQFRCRYTKKQPFRIWPKLKIISTDFAEGEAGVTYIKDPNLLLLHALLHPNETFRASVDVQGSLEKLSQNPKWDNLTKKDQKTIIEKNREYYELDSYCLVVSTTPKWAYTVLFKPVQEIPTDVWQSFRNPRSRHWIK